MMMKARFLAVIILSSGTHQACAAAYVAPSNNALAASIFNGGVRVAATSAPAVPIDVMAYTPPAPGPTIRQTGFAHDMSAPVAKIPPAAIVSAPLDNEMPEPQTWMLMMVGLAVVGRAMRQRARSFC
ncbi:PEP-CTERM sorting domain-containing protein [Sphingobium boeckii]|uniref:PEP-CTERM protein-sorting domain-containing protein n=1 Tax=Sphingobium boeckii TaxID=1082345 RepID=A0A7W9AH40_9SPHN|nr:PEP-CTERM sorting domain-containing protein [Sphingobium boeckii]MBB5685468.1 hypothetical protein [Sphingobium boeckii]